MLNRVYFSEKPVSRTRWPIVFVEDDGCGNPMIQINALYRWICIYLN